MNQGITMHQAKLHLDTRQLVYCLASFSGMLTFGLSWSDQKATMLFYYYVQACRIHVARVGR